MGHYTGPKARINRRLGAMIFESSGARRASERRDNPPGMSVSRRKPSVYGLSLKEKQKIKYYYGLSERQLRNMYATASRRKGNTGEELLILCERRLDNVVRRAGFALTRPQSRQGIAHGHFLVNGRKVDIASYIVRQGDVISVKPHKNLAELYGALAESQDRDPPTWITFDPEGLTATVGYLPTAEDISLPVEVGMVVELLSR